MLQIDLKVPRQIIGAEHDLDPERLEQIHYRARLERDFGRNLHREPGSDLAAGPANQCLEPFERGKWSDRGLHKVVGQVELDYFDPCPIERLRNFHDLVVGLTDYAAHD